MSVGGRLKELRKLRGLYQEDVARILGVTRQAVSQYERGERNPDIEALEKLADYFNVDMNYLLGKEDRSTYYIDPETASLAQEIFDNKQLRLLINDARDAAPEDIRMAHEMLLALKRKEQND